MFGNKVFSVLPNFVDKHHFASSLTISVKAILPFYIGRSWKQLHDLRLTVAFLVKVKSLIAGRSSGKANNDKDREGDSSGKCSKILASIYC